MLKNIGSVKLMFFVVALMAVPIYAEAADVKAANSAVENFESDSVPKGC